MAVRLGRGDRSRQRPEVGLRDVQGSRTDGSGSVVVQSRFETKPDQLPILQSQERGRQWGENPSVEKLIC